MIVPAQTTIDISPVTVELQKSDTFSTWFELQEGIVTLSAKGLEIFLGEETCPKAKEVKLKFVLISVLLGSNDQQIKIPIHKEDKIEKDAFSGVQIEEADRDQERIEEQKLIEQLRINAKWDANPLKVDKL